ncbi:MAG TPA: hypothetical protein VJ865_04185 [Gemmatimonadaceae bacterium]|nr:hypothetical protein [Gemmatimonadaceae bacterium]
MPSRSRVWRAVAAAFIAINVGGGIYAAATGEAMHAAVHVVLLVLGIAAYSALGFRRVDAGALPTETAERLKHLEQSVDALAIGVERVGEAQRYQTKILDEKNKVATAPAPAPENKLRKEES